MRPRGASPAPDRPGDAGADGPAPILRPLLILHRLSLNDSKLAFLREHGVEVARSRSVRRTCALLEAAQRNCAVVVDVSVGSQAPEKIHRCLLQCGARAARAKRFVGCTTTNNSTLRRRARALGLSVVLIWPEGAFVELVRFFADVPSFQLSRAAERAVVDEEFGSPEDELSGRLINLSATGAMIETDAVLEVGAAIGLELDVPGTDDRAAIKGTVVWTEPSAARTRLGVAFRELSPAVQEALAAFVHDLNAIRFNPGPATEPGREPRRRAATVRVQRERSRRVDYFLLDGDLRSRARLVPKRPFFVPYEIGERLVLRKLPGAPGKTLRVEVIERFLVDDARLDSLVGWIVQRVDDSDRVADD